MGVDAFPLEPEMTFVRLAKTVALFEVIPFSLDLEMTPPFLLFVSKNRFFSVDQSAGELFH